MFTKQKTITVTTKDFLEKEAVSYAEFTGKDGMPYLVQVIQDLSPISPRDDYDHAWKWVTSPKAGYTDRNVNIDVDDKSYFKAPLFLYRHSGDIISTKPFNCPWDSGCMGYAYINLEEQQVNEEQALKYLEAEVEEMNLYISGQVYGVVITNLETEEETEAIWGIYGSDYAEVVKDFIPDGVSFCLIDL